jgi:hypothetical protein
MAEADGAKDQWDAVSEVPSRWRTRGRACCAEIQKRSFILLVKQILQVPLFSSENINRVDVETYSSRSEHCKFRTAGGHTYEEEMDVYASSL